MVAITLFLCLGILAPLSAQKASAVEFCGVLPNHHVNPRNGEEIISDRFGNTYYESEFSTKDKELSKMMCVNSNRFDLILAGSWTAEEEEVICQVFNYLATIVTSSVEPGRIIMFKDDTPLGVLASATPFYDVSCGVSHNLLTRRLLAGRGDPDAIDGFIIVSSNNNQNFYFGADGPVPADEFDFHTVILHEAMHLLGFASRVNIDGNPIAGGYTYWDRRLHRVFSNSQGGEQLLLGEPSSDDHCCHDLVINPAFNLPDDVWDHVCDEQRIVFPVASEPTVGTEYNTQTTSTFVNSLSHFNEDCDGEVYVTYGLLNPGPESFKRNLHLAEIETLCHLGYTTPENCVESCYVQAEPDGLFFLNINETLELSVEDLVLNDILAPNAQFEYLGPDVGITGITSSFLDNQLVVTANTPGLYRVFYNLKSCNEECDRTSVFISVLDDSNCGECQLIADPGFENFSNVSEFRTAVVGELSGFFTPFLFRSDVSNNSPDLFEEDGLTSWFNRCGDGAEVATSSSGGNVAHFWESSSENDFSSEGMAIKLCRPILPGESGTISFEALTSNACQDFDPRVRINFTSSSPRSGEVISVNPGLSLTEYLVPIENDNSNPPEFVYIDPVLFSNDTDEEWDFIVLSGNATISPTAPISYMLDDLQVTLDPQTTPEVDVALGFIDSCLSDGQNSITASLTICSDQAPAVFDLQGSLVLPPELALAPGSGLPSRVVFPQGSDCVQFDIDLVLTSNMLPSQALGVNLVLSQPSDCSDFGMQSEMLEVTLPGSCSSCVPCAGANAFNIEAGNGLRLSASELPQGGLSNGCITLNGRLIIDDNYTITSSQIYMGPGAVIEVDPKSDLKLISNTILACDLMWHSIIVNSNAELIADDNVISDGEYSIQLRTGSRAMIQNNIFDGNYIGVYVPPSSNGETQEVNLFEPMVGNTFTCSNGCNMVDPYPGQPTNLGPIPLAGVWVEDLKTFTVGNSVNPLLNPNTFEGLRNGIVASATDLKVYGAMIMNILSDGNSFNSALPNGTGVFAKDISLLVQQNRIENVQVGVQGYNGLLRALNNTILKTSQGIRFDRADNRSEANDNTIEFVNNGIVNVNADYGSIQSIVGNTLTKLEISSGTAISLKNKSASSELSRVKKNTLNIFPKTYGILMWNWDGAIVQDNDISYLPSAPIQGWRTFGIWLYNSTGTGIYENNITSTADISFDLHGVTITQSPNTSICCTNTKGMRFGFTFGGASPGSSISGCTMENHYQMMRFEDSNGTVAQIGTQARNNNEWLGDPIEVGADFAHVFYGGSGDIVANAKFITELGCSDVMTPAIVRYNGGLQNCPGDASDWFEVDFQAPMVFDCEFDNDRCPDFERTEEIEGNKRFVKEKIKNSDIVVEELVIAPNPVNDRLTIIGESLLKDGLLIDLLDANGRIVKSSVINSGEIRVTLDVSNLLPGVYLLRLRSKNGKVKGRRIVISR